MAEPTPTHVVIVGGGFAGVACAKLLADEDRAWATLIDQNGYGPSRVAWGSGRA